MAPLKMEIVQEVFHPHLTFSHAYSSPLKMGLGAVLILTLVRSEPRDTCTEQC